MRPPPPYSFGQVGVPQPFSPIRLRQSVGVGGRADAALHLLHGHLGLAAHALRGVLLEPVAGFLAEGFEVGVDAKIGHLKYLPA